jgi:glutamine synthetase
LKLFEDSGIFSHREAEARHEIMLETYVKKIQIEARVIGDLAINHIIPPAVKYQTELAVNVRSLKEIGTKQGVLPGDVAAMSNGGNLFGEEVFSSQIEMITEISGHVNSIRKNVTEMIEERKKANRIENIRDKAIAYCDKVRPYFDEIRYHADKLELLVDDEMWPMTKYRELVTIR